VLSANQVYWEDIQSGMAITPLPKVATTQMLVKWAAASGDFNPLHYEDAFAVSQGVGKPIVHGQLKRSWLIQMITDWMGNQGSLKKFSCQFRAMDYPRPMKTMTEPQDGETLWCRGRITKAYHEANTFFVDCDIWIENGRGEKTTSGTSTVTLPSRNTKQR